MRSTGAPLICGCAGHTKSHAVNALFLRELPQRATCVTESYRAQRLAEMLASIAEYRAASPAFRHFWRRLALHDVVQFKRDFLVPEKLAFEAAVRRSKPPCFAIIAAGNATAASNAASKESEPVRKVLPMAESR